MRPALRGSAAFISVVLGACAGESSDVDLSSTTSAIDVASYVLPSMSELERTQIVRRYDHLDPTNVIPRALLEDTILYFDVNKARIPKQSYFIVIDLSKFSGLDRFWLVDLGSGAVESHKTAHGDGSDPDSDGYATMFSNENGSHKSSLGFYLTGEIYDGTHVHSMKLDGLSPDGSPNGMANTNVRERAIVVHEASYVNDATTTKQGRSNGCPALDPDIEVSVVDRVHDGSLMYIATMPLNTAVGRATCGDATCDGGETEDSCATDCALPEPEPQPEPETVEEPAGCAAGGSGAGMLFAFAFVGIRRRRKS
jgi:uncharacterized protein (TIGR03382 family)